MVAARALTVFQAFFLLAVALAPFPAAQAQAGSFQVTELQVPPAMVLDRDNLMQATVSNPGPGPVTPEASFTIVDSQGVRHVRAVPSGAPLLGGSSRVLSVNWDGHSGSGPMHVGAVTVTFHVSDAASDAQATRSVLASLESHKMGLEASDESGTSAPPLEVSEPIVATVMNQGSRRLPLTLELIAPDGGWADWTVSFRPDSTLHLLSYAGEEELAPGATQQVFVYFTAPVSATEGSQGRALLSARAYEGDPTFELDLHSRAPTVAAGGRIALDVLDAPTTSLSPGGTARFAFAIRNDQNFGETGYIVLRQPVGSDGQLAAADPASSPDEPVGLLPGAEQDFDVEVSLPASGAGARSGTHAWSVEFHSTRATQAVTLFPQALAFGIGVVPQPVIQVQSVTPTSPRPGQELTVALRFCNEGNAAATYRLAASVAISGTPVTWPGANEVALAAPLAPDACESTGTASLPHWRVRVPEGTPAGSANLRFAAQDLTTGVSGPATFQVVSVAQAAIPVLESLDGTQPVQAGESRSFPLRLRNAGNMVADFTLSSQVEVANPTTGWTTTAPPSGAIRLQPGQSRDETFTIKAPNTALARESGMRVLVSLAGPDPSVPPSATLLRALPPFPDLRACPAPSEGAVAASAECPPFGPGATAPSIIFRNFGAVLDLDVQNLGAKASGPGVELKVEFSRPDGQLVAVRTAMIPSLGFGAGEGVHRVRVPVPTGSEGALGVRATVDTKGAVDELDEGNNVLQASLSVEVFGVQVAKPTDLLVHAGEELSFTGPLAFHVTNLGSRGHDVIVSPRLDVPWTQFNATAYVGAGANAGNGLARGTTVLATPTFKVPLNPGRESANLTLRVSHADHPSIFVDSVVRLRVEDTDAPVLSTLEADRTRVPAGGRVVFSGHAVDTTGIREARLVLVGPTGLVKTVTMAPNAALPDGFVATANLTEAGTHQAYFWAKDRSWRGNVADGIKQAITITVLPESGPRLQLVFPSDPSVPIRPGTLLLWNVAGSAPMASLRYSTGGPASVLPLTNPVEVVTQGLPDGPYNVTLSAMDILGLTANRTDRFTIDGRPPEVGAIRVGRGPGSLEVNATVRDASGVRSVLLRIEDVDGQIHDLRMASVGGQAYVANVTDDLDAVRSLQVIAEDAAGNRGFAEQSLAARSENAEKAPSHGTAFLLGVLAIAALMRRRRA